MAHKKILVLGAGLAGLSAAWHLQKRRVPCEVFEKESEAGGLCRSKTAGGFTFDYDGHLLHFRHEYTLGLVKKLLGSNLVKHKRSAWVYCYGRFVHYPFQANLYGLPSNVVEECLAGFVKARSNGCGKQNGDFLHWIKGTFGGGIARHFMVPYNTKFWTVPPQKMSCGWLDGFVPQPTLTQLLAGSIKESRQQLGYNAHFWYPKKGGIGQLPLALSQRVGNVRLGFAVRKIDLKKREVRFSNGVRKAFDHLISTIPLPEMARLIGDFPGGVAEAFRDLRWNSILNLNFGLKQKRPCEKHWIYFPQKELSFFRVGFFHNFSAEMCPDGKSSLYAEVSYSRKKPVDKRGIAGRVERDLRKVGLLSPTDKIVLRDANDIRYGYPIYDGNYAKARERILEFLRENHVSTCGRYGSWRYMSMEDVIIDGRDLAERLAY